MSNDIIKAGAEPSASNNSYIYFFWFEVFQCPQQLVLEDFICNFKTLQLIQNEHTHLLQAPANDDALKLELAVLAFVRESAGLDKSALNQFVGS